MKKHTLIAFVALPLLACSKGGEPDGARFQIKTSPLSLVGVTNVCYRMTVTNGPARTGDIVWQADVCADEYGDGLGAVAYVGPCDAGVQVMNSVTLELLDMMADTPPLPIGDADYQNPCGEVDWDNDRDALVAGEDPYGPCTIDRTCEENRDVLVTFDITVMRRAYQGFFDIAVEFSDIFCSAKLDCRPQLLHDGDGDRGPTAVVAFACTAGENQQTHMYVSDLVLTCDAPSPLDPIAPMVIPASLAIPGQHGPIAPGVFEWAAYRDDEQLTSNGQPLEKCFWNRAIGLDTSALAGRNCTLSGVGTASEAPLVAADLTTPGSAYPYVLWNVQVLAANGALCGSHPLGGDDGGVATLYATAATDAQTLSALGSAALFTCGVTPPTSVACDAGPPIDDVNAAVTATLDGQDLTVSVAGSQPVTVTLPAGYALGADCFQDSCCQE